MASAPRAGELQYKELHLTRDIDMSCGNQHVSLPMSFQKDNSQGHKLLFFLLPIRFLL